MFHESRKVSEVGSAREEGRVLKQNEKGVASLHKSNQPGNPCLGRWVCTCSSDSTDYYFGPSLRSSCQKSRLVAQRKPLMASKRLNLLVQFIMR